MTSYMLIFFAKFPKFPKTSYKNSQTLKNTTKNVIYAHTKNKISKISKNVIYEGLRENIVILGGFQENLTKFNIFKIKFLQEKIIYFHFFFWQDMILYSRKIAFIRLGKNILTKRRNRFPMFVIFFILVIFSKMLQNFTNIGKWLRRIVRIFFPNLINAIFREYSIISCQKKKTMKK